MDAQETIDKWKEDFNELIDSGDLDAAHKLELDLSNLELTEIPGDLFYLDVRYLNLDDNEITRIDHLPRKLISLSCQNNGLEKLGKLPKELEVLNLRNNDLEYLPRLPNYLDSLDCSYNALTQLPELNYSLRFLYCEYNNLTYLPELPVVLLEIDCSNNNISQIPYLPNGIVKFNAQKNPLESEPNRPSSAYDFKLPPMIDQRNFGNWSDSQNQLTCFSETDVEDKNVVNFLSDDMNNNIILNVNGILKCYQRTFLHQQFSSPSNKSFFRGIEYVKLFNREFVSIDSFMLLLDPRYSLYNLEPLENPIRIKGRSEYEYSVAAYTVDQYSQNV